MPSHCELELDLTVVSIGRVIPGPDGGAIVLGTISDGRHSGTWILEIARDGTPLRERRLRCLTRHAPPTVMARASSGELVVGGYSADPGCPPELNSQWFVRLGSAGILSATTVGYAGAPAALLELPEGGWLVSGSGGTDELRESRISVLTPGGDFESIWAVDRGVQGGLGAILPQAGGYDVFGYGISPVTGFIEARVLRVDETGPRADPCIPIDPLPLVPMPYSFVVEDLPLARAAAHSSVTTEMTSAEIDHGMQLQTRCAPRWPLDLKPPPPRGRRGSSGIGTPRR